MRARQIRITDGSAVRRTGVIVTLLLAGFGCASASTSSAGEGGGSGNTLTNADLVESAETDSYLAVQRLRPRWLRPRGQSSLAGGTVVMLFVDGSPRGDVSNLRGISITDVRDITYLSASEAAFQFGTIAGTGGALVVRTMR